MSRLPNPGQDQGTWGDVLNDFLKASHNTDGSLKTSSISSAGGELTSAKGQPNGYASLDGSGKVPTSQLPAASTSGVTSVNTQVGDVVLVKSDLGLSDVDNTSDVEKPLSNAATAALAGKVDSNDARLTDQRTPVDDSVTTVKILDESVTEAKLSAGVQSKLNTAVGSNVTSVAGKTGAVTLFRTDVGLGNVDDTSDIDKPISNATQAALDTKYQLPGTGVPEADLSTGVQTKLNAVTPIVLDDITDVSTAGVVAGQALVYQGSQWGAATIGTGGGGVTDHGALTGLIDDDHTQYHNDTRGDVRYYTKAQVDTSLTAKASTSDSRFTDQRTPVDGSVTTVKVVDASITEAKLSSAVQTKLNAPNGAVDSVAGKTGAVTLFKADVGLGNVDNTSDVSKPVSTATATALSGKASTSHTHGVTDLTATGTKSSTTFLRGDNTWAVPAGGSGGTVTAADITDATTVGRSVLTATDAAVARTAIGAGTSSLVIGTTSTTAKAGNYAPTKADVGLANVDNTADADKAISGATQAVLDITVKSATAWAANTAYAVGDYFRASSNIFRTLVAFTSGTTAPDYGDARPLTSTANFEIWASPEAAGTAIMRRASDGTAKATRLYATITDPVSDGELTTKLYVDSEIAGVTAAARPAVPVVVVWSSTVWQYKGVTITARPNDLATGDVVWFIGNPGGTLPAWAATNDVWTQG